MSRAMHFICSETYSWGSCSACMRTKEAWFASLRDPGFSALVRQQIFLVTVFSRLLSITLALHLPVRTGSCSAGIGPVMGMG